MVAAGLPALGGCAAGQQAGTAQETPDVAGADGTVGEVSLVDVFIEAGATAPLCGVLTDDARQDDDLLRASADRIGELRRQVAEVLRADAVDIDEWEIAVVHRSRPAGDAACVRCVWLAVPAGHVDGMVDAFRMTQVSRIEDLPGFCSVSLLVDRPGHRGVLL